MQRKCFFAGNQAVKENMKILLFDDFQLGLYDFFRTCLNFESYGND